MLFEGFEDAAAVLHVFFDSVVGFDKSRHQFNHLIQQIPRNNYHAFQWVTEYGIALEAEVSGTERWRQLIPRGLPEISSRRRSKREYCELALLLRLPCPR